MWLWKGAWHISAAESVHSRSCIDILARRRCALCIGLHYAALAEATLDLSESICLQAEYGIISVKVKGQLTGR